MVGKEKNITFHGFVLNVESNGANPLCEKCSVQWGLA